MVSFFVLLKGSEAITLATSSSTQLEKTVEANKNPPTFLEAIDEEKNPHRNGYDEIPINVGNVKVGTPTGRRQCRSRQFLGSY